MEKQTVSNPTTDLLKMAREYLANNAAESGSDVIIAGLCEEVERLRGLLWQTAGGPYKP